MPYMGWSVFCLRLCCCSGDCCGRQPRSSEPLGPFPGPVIRCWMRKLVVVMQPVHGSFPQVRSRPYAVFGPVWWVSLSQLPSEVVVAVGDLCAAQSDESGSCCRLTRVPGRYRLLTSGDAPVIWTALATGVVGWVLRGVMLGAAPWFWPPGGSAPRVAGRLTYVSTERQHTVRWVMNGRPASTAAASWFQLVVQER